jgi:hypothetical protein
MKSRENLAVLMAIGSPPSPQWVQDAFPPRFSAETIEKGLSFCAHSDVVCRISPTGFSIACSDYYQTYCQP